MKHAKIIVIGVFFFVGVIMSGVCVYMTMGTLSFIENAQSALGTVIRFERRSNSRNSSSTYAPVVKFSDEKGREIEFVERVSSSSWSHSEGDTVEVLFETGNSRNARINSFFYLWFGSLITGLLGVVFTAVATVVYIPLRRRRRDEVFLRSHGASIQALVTEVRHGSFSVNGRKPHVIECQWKCPMSGMMRVSVSDDLWFNPLLSGHVSVGGEIRVFFDPRNSRRSHVDIDHLIKMA